MLRGQNLCGRDPRAIGEHPLGGQKWIERLAPGYFTNMWPENTPRTCVPSPSRPLHPPSLHLCLFFSLDSIVPSGPCFPFTSSFANFATMLNLVLCWIINICVMFCNWREYWEYRWNLFLSFSSRKINVYQFLHLFGIKYFIISHKEYFLQNFAIQFRKHIRIMFH